MKRSTKITTAIITFFVIIAIIIIGRHIIKLHFQKKFGTRPPPAVIIVIVENKTVSKTIRPIKKSNYFANEQKDLVKNIKEIEKNIIDQKFEVIDARSKKRFEGSEPEPRPGLRSGHIKNSKNFPFIECINKSNYTFKNKEDLIKIFEKTGLDKSKNPVFSCGSGVTASVLSLAFQLIHDNYSPTIYDGS